MEKILKLYTYVDGGIIDTPFPNSDNPIEIGAFRYDAKRMGGAPTITASVDYPSCLDNEWTDNVYAEFNGEKYYLKQIPTSSYDNADVMYRHEVTLVSERVILDTVYFFDVVTGNPSESDKPVSNSTKVTFFGGIRDFASRLNASLEYSGLDYEVVVDDEITTEEKLMSFEDQFFSNVLQAIYNTYEVPYYFDGKTIHIGYAKSDVVVPDLSYGVDNALLSISKNNANYKTVNRATGYGSSENLTFYYPNNSPKGDITFEVNAAGENLDVSIIDYERYSDKVGVDEAATFVGNHCEVTATYVGNSDTSVSTPYNEGSEYRRRAEYKNGAYRTVFRKVIQADGETKINFTTFFSLLRIEEWINSEEDYREVEGDQEIKYHATVRFSRKGEVIETHADVENGSSFVFPVHEAGSYFIDTEVVFIQPYTTSGVFNSLYGVLKYHSFVNVKEGWFLGEQSVDLKDIGIHCAGTPTVGDTITQRLARYVNTSKNLMPSIYRQSDAKERFYNAINYPFTFVDGYELNYGEYVSNGQVHNDAYKDDEGNYIRFDYPYVEGKAKEHIVAVEDLMPTIKEAVNSMGLRMDMFSEFAYDDDDSDETEENEDGSDRDFVHSYFFAKLRKLDFNLFECAIEQQPMTISFTSGDCGACNFEIGVTEEFPQKNPVRVNPDGTLMRDANGRVVCGQFEPIYENEIQDRQQDTINNEVWIALRKEEDTYGELMPKAPVDGVGGHRPKACSAGLNDGDSFVILGINLPEEYVTRQERKLEKEIIKYIKDNNEEKFTFSIGFSRIYFAENENILQNLSENSKVRIFYNDLPYDLYVSSFSYNLNAGDVLPDINIELDETLKISQNPIQKAISQVKSQLGNALSNIDVVGAGTPYFLRKDVDDEVIGRVNFRKGVKFGEGGKVEILDNNSAKLTIDYIEVTKKATFTSLEIQEKTHVGGQLLVTLAAINCGEVEEFEDYYRCYFQTHGEEGEETYNLFIEGDQAICQTYNTWGSKYYWRLVVGVGDDYIDLSKREGEYDEDSDAPSVGDKIIQLGHRTLEDRQNAIVIAAHGDNSPYIIQYKGIDNFNLGQDKIVTKLSSTENIFTGKVHMELGSDGLENIDGGLNIGGQNLLRNSGFTGSYLSEPLTDEIVMDATKELYSDPLDFWFSEEHPVDNASVVDSDVSSSGKLLVINNGSVTQELYQRVIKDESYVLSFKAKGTHLTYNVGGISKEVILTDNFVRYVEKISATSDSNLFSINNALCEICDVQLERGTIATAWGVSPYDNSSDRAYYQSLRYLADSVANEAATQGATDVFGGLILTNHIKVGEYANKTMIKETGGVSGKYDSQNSVAFWAGGEFDKALATANKHGETSTTTPEGEASFVVTHGGKAVMNDAIVRGEIHANSGSIGDLNINTDNYGDLYFSGTIEYEGNETHSLTLSPEHIDITSSAPHGFESIRINPLAYIDKYDMSGVIDIIAKNGNAAISIQSGHVSGLRYETLSTDNDEISLKSYSPQVIILNSVAENMKSIIFASEVEKGSFFQIINAHRSAIYVGMHDISKRIVFNTLNGLISYGHGWNDGANNPYKIEAYYDGELWYLCPIK